MPILDQAFDEYDEDPQNPDLGEFVDSVYVATQYVAPEKAETLRFLRMLETLLVDQRQPVKDPDLRLHDRADLREALRLLQGFANSDGPLHVVNLNRYQMACQLGCRVYDIRLIGQGRQSLCGPNSFIYSLARSDIPAYVELAIDLLENGRARINQADANFEVRVGTLQNLVAHNDVNIDDVDMVVLGSLRSSVLAMQYVIDRGTDDEMRTGYTTPPQLMTWLRHAGFRTVEDHTLINFSGHHPTVAAHYRGQPHGSRQLVDFGNRAASAAALSVAYVDGEAARRYSKGNASLRECQAALLQGRQVFILHDSRLSSMAMGDHVAHGGFDRTNLHWAMVNQLRTAGRTVSADLVTWGRRSNINTVMPIDRFLEYWGGFVSAQP
jgi:hypothetical protein